MRRWTIALLLVTATCTACGSGNPSVQADRIRAADSAFLEAMAARNFDGMMAIYASDARELLPNLPPIEGRDSIEAFFKGLAARNPRFVHRFAPEEVTVAASADLAVVTGTYRFTPDSLQRDVYSAGKFAGIWRREGDEWRLAIDIASSVLPQGAPAEGAEGDSTRAAVLGALTSYYAAFSDRDWSRFASHFWPGATIATVWQPPGERAERVFVQSIPAFVAQAPDGPGSRPIFEERMLSADVTVRGALAVVVARYRARFGDPGDVAEWEGTDVFTLMAHDGEWGITSLAFASDQ